MENQQTSLQQIMLNFGLYLGVTGILINVIMYATGNIYDPHWSVMVVGLLVTIGFIIYGIKQVKEMNGGLLSLGEALKTGLGIALISGIIAIVYSLIFTNFIEPDFYEKMAEVSYQKILEEYPNFTDEQIEAATEMASKMSGPGVNAAMMIMGSLISGLIISLIGGSIMRKKED